MNGRVIRVRTQASIHVEAAEWGKVVSAVIAPVTH